MMLFLWLLQGVAEMVRNLVLIVSWPTLSQSWLGIFLMVLQGRCGVIQDFCYGSRM